MTSSPRASARGLGGGAAHEGRRVAPPAQPGPSLALGVTLVLLGLLAVAAFLRLDRLGAPSYWLDEILGDTLTTKALHAPWWQWIAGLETEHGPLYYATQAATRLVGRGEAAGRSAAALFGLLTIPLVYFIPRRPMDGIASAILLATSPVHVYYSREARPYALLMLLTAVLLIALPRQRLAVAAAALVAMLYTSAVAGPLIVAAAVTLAAAAWLTRERRTWTFAAVAGAAAIGILLLYGGQPNVAKAAKLDAPLTMKIVRSLTVSAFGFDGHGLEIAALLLLAIVGAVAMARRDRALATIVAGMTLLPVAAAVASLTAIGHWFATRYVSAAVIGLVVLAGTGIGTIGSWLLALGSWGDRAASREPIALLLTVVIATILAADTWAAARREAFQKLDWRAITATLERHVKPGDAIVLAEEWSQVCIGYYLHHLPPSVRIVAVRERVVAEMFAMSAKPVWFVTADSADTSPVSDWMCRYPLLLAGESPLDHVRIHYAPSARDFVRQRAGPADLRAIAWALGPNVRLHSGRDDELFRGDGWQGPEGAPGEEFRWATAKEATLFLPRLAPRDRRVVVYALPLSHPTLPAQTMTLAVNGANAGSVTMTPGWSDTTFNAPTAMWHEGLNTLTFTFGHVVAPLQLGLSDPRPLAVNFQSVSILDGGRQALMPVLQVRLAEPFRTRCSWPGKHTRFERLNAEAAQSLLARLGFDPQTAWPPLARGELHLEDVADSLAIESTCEDERAFLFRAFDVIAQRKPNEVEQRELRGKPRTQIIDRILRAADVRKNLTR